MTADHRQTDAQLLAAAERDPEAFGEFYDRHAHRALVWAQRAGLPNADALDLVAELFAQAWVSRRRFRDSGDGDAAPWLYGIARHLLAAHRRRGRVAARARRRLGIPPAAPDHGGAVVERLDAERSRADIGAALAELPAAQGAAVRMRVVEELEYADLAARMDCTEATARKRVSLGLRSLRRRLGATR
jgi:RNA polymerase sigma factor (sigma-70 family)